MRPKPTVQYTDDMLVSIHASVKDATGIYRSDYNIPQVSIHASVKDATLPGFEIMQTIEVSIHASVKDATSSPLL